MNPLPLLILKNDNPVDNNVKPALILKAVCWDDYGYKTSFSLTYRKENGDNISIGDVKIGSVDYKPNGDNYIDEIMDPFYLDGKLSAKFFSLGQDLEYYRRFKEFFPECYQQILENLRDCVVLPTLAEKVEQEDIFKTSLLRSEYQKDRQSAQEAFDYGMDILKYGKKILDQTFEYVYNPYGTEIPLRIHFDFNGSDLFPRRLYALIGDNGVGKTTLLNDIPVRLYEQKNGISERFYPYPLFKKIITISLNQYDSFEYPERSESFNYVYCGLVDKISGKKYSQENIIDRTIESLIFIYQHNRHGYWRYVVNEILEKNLTEQLDDILLNYCRSTVADDYENRNKLRKLLKGLSSGQNSLLSVFSNVFAEIRYKSLLLLDEPEMHLHPKAISKLVKILLRILDVFESFCAIATHSPLVVRELTSDCVYVMEKRGEERIARFIGFESLGANLTTLMNGIFGINDEKSYFMEKICALKSKGLDESTIISIVQSKTGHPIDLNLRLYIASIFNLDEKA